VVHKLGTNSDQEVNTMLLEKSRFWLLPVSQIASISVVHKTSQSHNKILSDANNNARFPVVLRVVVEWRIILKLGC